MTSRYDNRDLLFNFGEKYRQILKNRNVKSITQFSTPSLKFPTVKEMGNLQVVGHLWKLGDRFYKVADKYYNDPELWWVIAWFNHSPTEAHIAVGEIVDVPLPVEQVLQILDI